jgi:hypothetical protein
MSFIEYPGGFYLRSGEVGYSFSMLPNAVIAAYLFLYYVFFRYISQHYNLPIEKLLGAYLLFVFSLAALYIYDPASYFNLRAFWTMYGNVIEGEELNSHLRFTSTLSDPNNIAILICAIFAFFSLSLRAEIKYVAPVFIMSMVAVLSTMSTSGLALLFCVFVILMLAFLAKKHRGYGALTFSVGIVVLVFILGFWAFDYLNDTRLGAIALERASNNSLESRFDIWGEVFDIRKILSSIFYGDGGLPILEGRAINPHNGHFYLIYSYGFFVYAVFIFLFFAPIFKSVTLGHAFLIVFLVGFTINVAVYELRFCGIMALMVAFYNSRRLSTFKS